MSHLKSANLKKCVCLLREFVEEAKAQNNKKQTAILALNHLQKIIAGAEVTPANPLTGCSGKPIADRP